MLFSPATVSASWAATARGSAYNRAKTMPTILPAPTATLAGSAKVKIGWGAASYTEGGTIVAYTVRRYPAAGGAGTIRAGCNGTISALTCTENNVATGGWAYAVTPVAGKWSGSESARSATVVVP